MKGNFGKTNFGGIIMHGMNNFGLISRMITDWAYPAGAIHRRLETRWVKPVRPGDTIQPTGIIKSKQVTRNSRWVLIDVMVKNQGGRRSRRARRWSNSRPKRRRDHSSGTPVVPRVVTRPPVDPRDEVRARRNDIAGETDEGQKPDCQPGVVDLPPAMAMPRRTRIGVVVIVPAFAVGDQPDDEVVAAVLVGFVVAVAPTWVTELIAQVMCQTSTVRTNTPNKRMLRPVVAAPAGVWPNSHPAA